MDYEKRARELKRPIPSLAKPVGLYKPAVRAGKLVHTSGQLPLSDNRLVHKGRLGQSVSLEHAQLAAKIALVNCLAAVKYEINDLNKIKQIVRLNGFVSSSIDFYDQPKVLNAASELLLQIFGDQVGAHTRTAIGCLELPMGACCELDLIVEIM